MFLQNTPGKVTFPGGLEMLFTIYIEDAHAYDPNYDENPMPEPPGKLRNLTFDCGRTDFE